MDRDPATTGTRRGPLLGGFLVLTAVLSTVSIVAMVGYGDGREEFATSAIVLAAGTLGLVAMAPAATYLATRLPDVFPGMAIPGMLDGRGISGLVRRAPFVLEMLMLMALAVHLLRVTVSTAPARAEVAG